MLTEAHARSFAQVITADLHPINNNRVRKYLATKMGQSEEAIADWYRHWVVVAFDAAVPVACGPPV